MGFGVGWLSVPRAEGFCASRRQALTSDPLPEDGERAPRTHERQEGRVREPGRDSGLACEALQHGGWCVLAISCVASGGVGRTRWGHAWPVQARERCGADADWRERISRVSRQQSHVRQRRTRIGCVGRVRAASASDLQLPHRPLRDWKGAGLARSSCRHRSGEGCRLLPDEIGAAFTPALSRGRETEDAQARIGSHRLDFGSRRVVSISSVMAQTRASRRSGLLPWARPSAAKSHIWRSSSGNSPTWATRPSA